MTKEEKLAMGYSKDYHTKFPVELDDDVAGACLALQADDLTPSGEHSRPVGGEGRGRALGVGEVKFTGMVTPDVKLLTYEVDFKRIIDRKLKLGIANGVMKADGEVVYNVSDMRVGLFQDAA